MGPVEIHWLVEADGRNSVGPVESDGVGDVDFGCCGVEIVAGSGQVVDDDCWDVVEMGGGGGCCEVAGIGQDGVQGVAEMPDVDDSSEVVVVEVVVGIVDVVGRFDTEPCGELMGVYQVPVVGKAAEIDVSVA